jgi:very-short-patch-repair endonuclease
VKNLENVQGDERDAIFFSICYGPDAAGKIYENYGPLNQQGGERRLNVAITRARRELVVFTSVRPEQVATRTQALGAQHLRTFLDYALRGQQALVAAVSADPSGGADSPFEAAVRDALAQRGHAVHTQVGCSGYRIDLAVVDPRAAGRYLLGIECDGAAYHAAATARDRDRLRASVLTGLGWRLHRIWSTDFWQDPAGELERVEAAIAAAKAAPVPVEPPAPVPAAVPEPLPRPEALVTPTSQQELPPDPDGPRPYVPSVLPVAGTPEQFAEAKALVKLGAQAAAVLAAESPLSFDRFARALAMAWGIQRVTERVRERVRGVVSATAVEIDGVLWRNGDDAQAFRGFRVPANGADAPRAADELPLVEITNAMVWLLRQHHAMAGEDLAREAARCFGITRLGAVVRDVMQRAADLLVLAGRGVRDGEVVRLP